MGRHFIKLAIIYIIIKKLVVQVVHPRVAHAVVVAAVVAGAVEVESRVIIGVDDDDSRLLLHRHETAAFCASALEAYPTCGRRSSACCFASSLLARSAVH
ncbi:hypothetical protein BRADI_1g43402v3 [Brachypodium distachyon]|uniref:Secreted protein n=1 Tax=Brachypodium distachyon TaxID=15368 RepID=A0A0Q3S0P7_BRADI|nr:hypothetical protein BRADI_1g43402v3 [Brachypodium distachyon]